MRFFTCYFWVGVYGTVLGYVQGLFLVLFSEITAGSSFKVGVGAYMVLQIELKLAIYKARALLLYHISIPVFPFKE